MTERKFSLRGAKLQTFLLSSWLLASPNLSRPPQKLRASGWLICVLAAVLSQLACGYTFGSASGTIPKAEGRPVQVLTFRNLSSEADAGILLTRSLNEELSTRGALRGQGAPVYVEGSVEGLSFDPVGITWQGVSTWRAHLQATVILKDPSAPAGKKELSRRTFQEWDEYLGASDIESTEVSRRMAISRMIRALSEKAADALFD